MPPKRSTGPDLSFERAMADRCGGGPVAGLDEVGRGPWAGPVVACAVALPDPADEFGGLPQAVFDALDDSKKLTETRRGALFDPLSQAVPHAFGEASVQEIDDLNILQASLLAMRRALDALPGRVCGALVDGNRDPQLGVPTELIVKGDGRSIAIAAASVLAKVRRDRMMQALGVAFPGYGWERNMGYGTKEHQAGLATLGVTEHHRKSFAPIKARLQIGLNI